MPNWFKFYEDGIAEPRIQLCMAKQPLVLNVWLWILKECCRHGCGSISWKPYSAASASAELRVDEQVVKDSVQLLSDVEYVQLSDDQLVVRCWEERQSEYNRKKRKKQREESTEKRGEESCPTLSGVCPDNVRTSGNGHLSEKEKIDLLYQAYPKKVDRGHALNMIAKALKLAPFEQLIESVEAYAECVAGSDMKYVPNPGTWFNGRRWEDDRSQWKQNGKPALTVQDYNRMIARLEKEAQDWYNRHWTVYNGMDDKWDCTENGERYREMKAKIEEWKRKVEEMA